jgi:hypothetical protein
MSEARCAFFLGNFHHFRDDERSGQTRADRIFAFVKRISLNRWENVIFRELFSGINGKVL